MNNATMDNIDWKRIAARTAKHARTEWGIENGRKMTSDDLDAMDMTEISDLCRDAAWDILNEYTLDFDEHGMDVTGDAESALIHWFAPAPWEA